MFLFFSSSIFLIFIAGYMLLYFIVIQSITLLCSHIFSTSTISATISAIIIYLTTSVGGYVLHIQEIPFYWKWMEYVSPERWIFPVLLVNEFSHDTLTNSATQQLCRNRQVRKLRKQQTIKNRSTIQIRIRLFYDTHTMQIASQTFYDSVIKCSFIIFNYNQREQFPH